jgi:hypothetical protein
MPSNICCHSNSPSLGDQPVFGRASLQTGESFLQRHDSWLLEHIDEPFLNRGPEAERAASLRYLDAQPAWWTELVPTHAEQLPELPTNTRLFSFLIAGNETGPGSISGRAQRTLRSWES